MTVESPTSSAFLSKADRALRHLFECAREKDELSFALSLSPEFKPYTLTSAIDAQKAYREYGEFLGLKQFHGQGIRVRVALAFYCHAAEAAGLWGVPMCMLGVIEGKKYNTDPFFYLVKNHKVSGQLVAPNANRVMGTMAGCASELGLTDLAEVFRDAFDPDVRNGFAHADYALSSEGLHVRGRHDRERIVGWPELERLFNDGVGLFHVLGEVIKHYQDFYQTPKVVFGTWNADEPEGNWLIYSNPETRTMSVSGGPGCTPEALLDGIKAKQNSPSGVL